MSPVDPPDAVPPLDPPVADGALADPLEPPVPPFGGAGSLTPTQAAARNAHAPIATAKRRSRKHDSINAKLRLRKKRPTVRLGLVGLHAGDPPSPMLNCPRTIEIPEVG